MSYPGYPSQNPPYPPSNLPYPADPFSANNQNYGFSSPYPPQQPAGFTTPYPPMGPNPGYPSAPPIVPPAYPPIQHPTAYPTTTAPYPTSSPYPNMGYPSNAPTTAGYPSNPPTTAGYPPLVTQPPSQAPYPTQHAASMYPTQQPMSQPVPHHTPAAQPLHQSVKTYSASATISTKKTPTIIPAQPFDPRQDAEALRKAMKGFGTDEKAIINVLARRTNQQRVEITTQYKALFGKDLIKDLKSELSGRFEEVVMAMITPLPEYLARELHDAIDGLGTNEDTLIEILCTTNNAWIHAVNMQYQRLYSKSLEKDVKGDTSGAFQRLLVSMCQGRRDENPTVDIGAATADAHALYKAGAGRLGTDESTFNMILASRSMPQLRQVFLEYEKLSGKPLEYAIKSEFSGSIETGLLAIVKSMRNCPEYFAERLYNSMAGAGTKDRALIRIITVRAEFDLGDIKVAFQNKYKKTLASFIQGDTSGDYQKMLLAMIGA